MLTITVKCLFFIHNSSLHSVLMKSSLKNSKFKAQSDKNSMTITRFNIAMVGLLFVSVVIIGDWLYFSIGMPAHA